MEGINNAHFKAIIENTPSITYFYKYIYDWRVVYIFFLEYFKTLATSYRAQMRQNFFFLKLIVCKIQNVSSDSKNP